MIDVVETGWQVPASKDGITISGEYQWQAMSDFAEHLRTSKEIRLRFSDECGETTDIKLDTSGWEAAVKAFNADN